MIPTAPGIAASWFASFFGGAGQPAPTSSAPADSPQEWTQFSAFLQQELGGVGPVAPSVEAEPKQAPMRAPEQDAAAAAEAPAAPILVTPPAVPPARVASMSTAEAITLEAPDEAPAVHEAEAAATTVDAAEAGALAVEPDTASVPHALEVSIRRPAVGEALVESVPVETSPAPVATASISPPTAESESAQPSAAASAETSTPVTARPTATPTASTTGIEAPTVDVSPRRPTESPPTTPTAAPSPGTVDVAPPAQTVAPPTGTTAAPREIPTTAIVREVAAAIETAPRDTVVREALSRVQVRTPHETLRTETPIVRDLAARLTVRPSTAPTAAPGADGVADAADDVAPVEVTRPSMTETLVEEFLEDEAAHEAPEGIRPVRELAPASVAEDDFTGRTRDVAHATDVAPAAGPTETSPAVDRPAPAPIDATRSDLGARLRQAIVETLEAESRDGLLASVRDGWSAEVSVDPVSMGRVDVQVTRSPGGLEVILVAAHEEAARALDAEMDDMAEELLRRDQEPVKITVRTQDGGQDADRNSRQTPENLHGRSKERGESADGEPGQRRGRGRRQQELHEQEAGA